MLQHFDHDGVQEIRINRPPVNALNPELTGALITDISRILKNNPQAIVITGSVKVFSAGLDVPELLPLGRRQMNAFWRRFFELMQLVWTCPVPVVAAINGHAPAGGMVLALHCDYRIAAAGDFRLGLNEVQVGLPVPASLLRVLRHVVGYRQASQLATFGRMLSPTEALTVGLVDEVVPVGEVVSRSLEWLQSLLALPPVAMNQTRLAARADIAVPTVGAADIQTMTDFWFSHETRSTMQGLVDQLKK